MLNKNKKVMNEKIRNAIFSIIIGFAMMGIIYCFCMIIFEKDHVVDKPLIEIEGHVYKRIYSEGRTHLVDDIEKCPKCRDYIIHIADSITRSHY